MQIRLIEERGNFNHAGRQGQRGGSAPSESAAPLTPYAEMRQKALDALRDKNSLPNDIIMSSEMYKARKQEFDEINAKILTMKEKGVSPEEQAEYRTLDRKRSLMKPALAHYQRQNRITEAKMKPINHLQEVADGRGNHDHAGRKGQRGGSAPSGTPRGEGGDLDSPDGFVHVGDWPGPYADFPEYGGPVFYNPETNGNYSEKQKIWRK